MKTEKEKKNANKKTKSKKKVESAQTQGDADEMDQLDSIDTTLKQEGGKHGKRDAKFNKKHPDITGMSSGKKDRDEEAMMKDFGDVSLSDHELGGGGAAGAGSESL